MQGKYKFKIYVTKKYTMKIVQTEIYIYSVIKLHENFV